MADLRFFNANAPPFNYQARRPVAGWFHLARTTMIDLIFIAVTLGFFILGALYARYCESL